MRLPPKPRVRVKMRIDLNRIFFRYLSPEERTAFLSRVGVCKVCGEVHRSEREWRTCAFERSRNNPLFTGIWNDPLPTWVAKLLGGASVYGGYPDPVIVCVFPEDKEVQQKVSAEISRVMNKALDGALARYVEEAKSDVVEVLRKLGLPTNTIIKQTNPEDLAGHFMSLLLTLQNPPILIRLKKGKRKVVLNKRSPFFSIRGDLFYVGDKELDEVFSQYEKWLVRKLGLDKAFIETYQVNLLFSVRYEIETVDSPGKAIVRLDGVSLTPKGERVSALYEVDLKDLGVVGSTTVESKRRQIEEVLTSES